MKKSITIIIALVLIALITILYFLVLPKTEAPKADFSNAEEFTMTAKRWEFSPSTIEVNKGDNVRLKITSEDVTHGFSLSEFGINKNLKPGEEIIIEFTADKIGEFRFSCSVPCGAGHGGMSGKIIVK